MDSVLDGGVGERRGPISEEEFSVRGPGGMGMSFKGQSQMLLIIILFLVVSAAVAYLVYNQGTLNATNFKIVQDSNARIEEHLVKQDEQMKAMIWVLAQPEKKKEQLDLTKPKIINEMQR